MDYECEREREGDIREEFRKKVEMGRKIGVSRRGEKRRGRERGEGGRIDIEIKD